MFHPPPPQPPPTGAIPHRYSVPGFGSLVVVSPDTPERSSLRPWHGYPGPIAPHCPPPMEGAGGGRGAAGRWGWSTNTVQPETQETGEGGAVSASPLPVEPPPPRGDSPTDTVSREETTTSRSHLTLPEIRFPSPVHGYPDYRHLLPAPWKGAGGGRGSGRAAGVIDSLPEYRSR